MYKCEECGTVLILIGEMMSSQEDGSWKYDVWYCTKCYQSFDKDKREVKE